ncbi:unnamed protein product [Paramecium sonneborni]|uniref:Uncharacterized protein n=1 Tax=Paramecium sonneborni TaxID=65129 RepID=A0A8S1Q0H9_9CILI|nr:unnamed protein product [Paramecium sonneborni]
MDQNNLNFIYIRIQLVIQFKVQIKINEQIICKGSIRRSKERKRIKNNSKRKQKVEEIQQDLNEKQKSLFQSKESDMNNVFDLFGGDQLVKKNIGQADLKKIGENFTAALQNVGQNYIAECLKRLITKLEGKLLLIHYEALFKVVEDIYIQKREINLKYRKPQRRRIKNKEHQKKFHLERLKTYQDNFDNIDDDSDFI